MPLIPALSLRGAPERVLALLLAAAFASHAAGAEPAKKITYEDDVLPIFRDNCLKCHNPDKLKGDLDLSSFSAALKGGGSGATLNAGDPDGSQLYKAITHADEPTMPPNAKLNDRDIGTVRRWIEGGLLQGANSKAIAASQPAADLSLKSASVGRPDGPPPMPGALRLEPFVQAARGSALSAVAHSPWAPVVALAGAKQVVLYDTSDFEFLGVLPFAEGFPCDVKFSRNGRLVLASGGRGGQSGVVAIWDISTGARVITIGDQFDSVLAADVSSDQRWVALGGPDRVLKLYRTKDGALEHRKKKHTDWVTAVEFSPNAKYLATGDRNGGLVIWEAETGQEMFTLVGHKAAITAVSWRGDSEMLLSASEDGTLKLWKPTDGSALKNIPAHSGGVLAGRFAADGRIVSSGRDNKIQLWDATGRNLRSLPFAGDLPNRVTFNHDGAKVIASDWKGSVYVWDAKAGKLLTELEANPPTLAARVQASTAQMAALETEIAQAAAGHAALAAAAAAAQAKSDAARKALADTRARLAAKQGELKKLEAAAANPDAATTAPAPSLATAREAVAALEAQLANRQAAASTLTKEVAAAAKKAGDASKKLEALRARLAALRTSLQKWQAALQRTESNPGPAGKLTSR